MIRRLTYILALLCFASALLAQSTDIASLQSKAQAGDPIAQAAFGRAYQQGQGVTQSDALAVKWYRAAAEQGNAQAQSDLGVMYRLGRGVQQDKQEAVRWYIKSAAQRNPIGMFNLATCFYNGDGVSIDDISAYAWFTLAARAGNAEAADAVKHMQTELSPQRAQDAELGLGELLEKPGRLSDSKEAAEIYRKFAEQGNVVAQVRLAAMYNEGRGVSRDYASMKYWCERAGKKGSAVAFFCLGNIAQNGLVGPSDPKAAAQWYSKAAEVGHSVAMYRLGLAYAQGNGVKRNPVTAYRFLYFAAQNKVPEAETELKALEQTMSPGDLKKAHQSLRKRQPLGLVVRTENEQKK